MLIATLLGGALIGQKKYAEAEPLLLAAYEGMNLQKKENTPPIDSQLAETMERLVQLYEAWEKPDEADRWRKER